MKSLFITALITILVLANKTLALEEAKHAELEEMVEQYFNPEDNVIENNEFNIDLNDVNIENNTFEDYNVNDKIDTISDTNNDATIIIPQIINEDNSDSSNDDNESNTSVYLLGGVGFTSVALIAAFGYKNYRKRSLNIVEDILEKGESNNFKEESIIKPGEIKRSNTIKRLKRSISLTFTNKNENTIHCDKPIVSESIYTKYTLNKNRAYKCQIAWTPVFDDEIVLRLGDLICVKETYDDGYSLGRNLSTKFYGIFPTCCLSKNNEQIMGSELVKDGTFVSVLKRTSSKNKVINRNRRAVSTSIVLPSWTHSHDLNSIMTQ